MSGPSDRRGFLRGLVSLPLIGGGVTLIGNPTKAAEPCCPDQLWRYANWCGVEYRTACAEYLATQGRPSRDFVEAKADDAIRLWQLQWEPIISGAPPSTRAPIVLAAVGCNWRRWEP